MKIVTEPKHIAPKLLIYGLPSAGKTVLSTKVGKKPLILDVENGANQLKVARIEQSEINSYEKFYKVLSELFALAKAGKLEYDNIVIDSIDELVRMIEAHVSGAEETKDLKATIYKGDGAYGNGKKFMENEIRLRLLKFLDLFGKCNVGVTLIAHASQKKLLDAEGNHLDTIAPKMDEYIMNLFVEHMDFVYYLKKGDDGERRIVTESDGIVLAKNRVGISGEYSLSETNINDLLVPRKEK